MNSSGPISLAGTTAGVSIEIENGGNGTTQISLNDTAVRSLAGVTTPNSTIIMPTNFYGKANEFSFAIAANAANVNLRSAALAAGWNGSSKLVCTINSGIYVYSASTGSYALTINGNFPGGVTLNNAGNIVGKGGAGGNAGPGGYSPEAVGGIGGPGLLVQSAVSINNTGNIAGGGGGGGGGQGTNGPCNSPCGKNQCCGYDYDPAGGGGGGASLGTAGPGCNAGAAASYANAGGSGGYPCGGGGVTNYKGYGGPGGGWGSSGQGGCSGNYGGGCGPGRIGNGGAAGACISGNSNITWIATGNRYGAIG